MALSDFLKKKNADNKKANSLETALENAAKSPDSRIDFNHKLIDGKLIAITAKNYLGEGEHFLKTGLKISIFAFIDGNTPCLRECKLNCCSTKISDLLVVEANLL